MKVSVISLLLAASVSPSPIPDQTADDRYAKLGQMFKTTSTETSSQNIVKINNTEELTRFIWDFVEENSKSRKANVNRESDGVTSPEKVSLETLGTIRQKLSRFISESGQQYPVPKAIRDKIETEDDVRNQVSLIVAEQENIYNTNHDEVNNLEQQVKIIQDQLTGSETDTKEEEEDFYVNGELLNQTEETTEHTDTKTVIIGPENKVTWTLSNPNTPNSQMSSNDYYNYEEYDNEDSGSFPSPSVAQPAHIIGSNALSSLDALFAEHLPSQHSSDSALDLLTRLHSSPVSLPESETLNIILTPGTSQSQHPNIAILPTQDLLGFSSNISQDIGVDIEAILSSLAGSASKLRNQPMIVEENHTQLIKQPGRPTKLKIKETMSEILGDSNNPKINVLKNKEEENSFSDLESLIRGVTGDSMSDLSQEMPKANFEDQLKLNVSTKTNIVNIFAFNIYPSSDVSGPVTEQKYQVNDFSSLGTSINTEANVLFQPPGGLGPSHITSHYDFQSQPGQAPGGKKTMDKVLGAVLLSQLEGGGSDRVIEALGQNPAMMMALLDSRPGSETDSRPGGQASHGGLYGSAAEVDNFSEYAPGPYGLIARNNAIEKLIFAMTQAESSQVSPSSGGDYSQFLTEMPDYAKLLLNNNNNQNPVRERADKAELGPLGYSLSQKVGEKTQTAGKPQDFLKSVGGSAAAALMAGAVVTYPYWLPLLAGRRRKRRRRKRFVQRTSREGNPEISTDWLALLTGSKYDENESIDDRLDNWVTKSSDIELQQSSDDNRIIRPKIKEKVRVDLSQKKKEEIKVWREKYQDKIRDEEGHEEGQPDLYSNYYPVNNSPSTTQTTSSTTKTTTTTTNTTTTNTTTTTTTTPTSTTTSTTINDTTTTATKTPSKTTTEIETKEKIPSSLLFWTTARPYKPFKKSTITTSSQKPATTTDIKPSSTTPTSGFMWFTKSPVYRLSTAAPGTTERSPAWWGDRTVFKVSAYIKDSTSTTSKSVIQNYNRDSLYPKDGTIKANFNNGYSYDQPITRAPQVKVDWEEKFRPVKVTPLYETKLQTGLKIKSKPSKEDNFFLLEDIAPKSSISLNLKENSSKNVPENKIKNVDLPKWPYVENLWNKVDQIVDDLLEPENSEDTKKTDSEIDLQHFISQSNLATSGLKETENENLLIGNVISTTGSPRPVPDQAYWQNLKEKYGFISAYTEQYPERSSTTNQPEVESKPVFYQAPLPQLQDIILQTSLQTVTAGPQVIETSNQLTFTEQQPAVSEPYARHPSILVARRNISSSGDVLGYLNHLMKETNKDQQQKENEPSIRETTTRNFFKPDLLPSESFPILSTLDKIQESLVSAPSVSPNWLTAEDILNAAEGEDGKFTHSPILLIPYDEEKSPDQDLNLDLKTLPKDIFSTNNFAILDTLSAHHLEENNKGAQMFEGNGITSQSSNENTIYPRDNETNLNDKTIFFNKILAPIESITFSPPVEYIMEGNSVSENLNEKSVAPILPGEIVIQSSPIQTELSVATSYSTAQSLATSTPSQISLENEKMDSTAPSTNGNKLSNTNIQLSDQQQLIDFIQKLMGQAKKEQEKMKTKTPPPVELQLDIQKVDLSNFSPISISKLPQMDLKDFVSPVTEARQSITTTTTTTTTKTTSTTTSLATTTERVREKSETAPVLPFRTTLRTSTTSTESSTTEDGTPSGVITKLLSEAAAPIAGLSAATLAYSAAAMLPVWLPVALGRRRRTLEDDSLSDKLNLLASQTLYENSNLSA